MFDLFIFEFIEPEFMFEFIEPEFMFIEPEFIFEFIELEFIFIEFMFIELEFVFVVVLVLVLALVLVPDSQAIPNAPKAKTAERAKVFFIVFLYLLSSSKIKFISETVFKTVLFHNTLFMEHWSI